jgi:hypothetical protein
MKIFYGFLFLAAGQTLGVNGWAIRWVSPPIDGEGAGIQQRERLVPRHHHQKEVESVPTGSLDLRTIVGTGQLGIGNATATALDTLTVNPLTISLPTGLVTDTRRTVTVTKTEIAFATTTATADLTTTSALVAVVSGPGFGGIPGQIATASAPTAGQVVTIAGGQDSFGGVAGVIVLDPSATTSTTSDTSSTSSVVTLPVDTPLALGGTGGFGGVVGATTVDASTDISTTTTGPDIAATSVSVSPALVTPEGGVGAFGGVVGIQVNPVNLVSTASSFAGFGGIAGLVAKSDDTPAAATPVTYGKRNTFERAVNIEGGVPGTFPSRTN